MLRQLTDYQNDVSEGLKSGQSLVEVLVSLSIATLVLSAITVGVVYSLRNAQFSKNQNLASQYASQGMEIIRQIRDDKSTLSDYSGDYCLGQDSKIPVFKEIDCGQNVGPKDIGPTPSSVYIYTREVKIEQPPIGECGSEATTYKVTVKVSWWDNVCGDTSNFCHKVNLVSCLSDRDTTLQL